MPMVQALRLAPHAKVVPPRFNAYAETSEAVFEIFHRFTPLVEGLSLDEAFLDVSGSLKLRGSPIELTTKLREQIANEVHLPCSAGIAPVKFVAKLASDLAKPNGQREVTAEGMRAFLEPLSVSRLWGVGPKTEAQLHKLGLRTLGDVARADPAFLQRHLGDGGAHLQQLSRGEDDREVVPDRQAKSIGAENTFSEDLEGAEALLPHLLSQSHQVARRLRRAHVQARTVQLKVKRSDHRVVTRQVALNPPSQDGRALYEATRGLLDVLLPRLGPVRLTGVSGQNLEDEGGGQAELFSSGPNERKALNQALDRIAQRFGTRAVIPADLKDNHDED
jgi:DNA polymerase-4